VIIVIEITDEGVAMKHVYLTKESVRNALQNHVITPKEAQKLEKCLECQEKIAQILRN